MTPGKPIHVSTPENNMIKAKLVNDKNAAIVIKCVKLNPSIQVAYVAVANPVKIASAIAEIMNDDLKENLCFIDLNSFVFPA